MKQKTLHRLLPLIITMALGLFLTASYIKKHTTDNAQCTEIKSSDTGKKARSEFMMWQSLSRHLLSLNN